MATEYLLLLPIVKELIDRLESQKYIISVNKTDTEISFEYNDGFKKKFLLKRENNDTINLKQLTHDITESLSSKFNKDFEDKFKTIQTILNSNSLEVKTQCSNLLNLSKVDIQTDVKCEIERKFETLSNWLKYESLNGKKEFELLLRNIKDDLESKINQYYETLLLLIENKIRQLKLEAPIELDKDLIINEISSGLFDKINEYKLHLNTSIETEVKKQLLLIELPEKIIEIDEKAISDKLLQQLTKKITDDFFSYSKSLNEEILNIVGKQKDEITLTFNKKLTKIITEISDLSDIKNKAIEETLLNKLNEIISLEFKRCKNELLTLFNQNLANIYKELKRIERIKPERGERGRQGDKGEKGDRGESGNNILNVKVDSKNHLIVTTDNKIIDAGQIKVKRLGGGGGQDLTSNFLYTNELEMPYDVGLLPKGTKFKDANLKVLFTKLLYGYNFPKFSDFFIDNLTNDVEIGYKFLGGDYSFNFNITDPELFKDNSIIILKDNLILKDSLPNLSPINISLEEETRAYIWTTVFEISAYDTTGVSFNKYYNLNYKYKIYYGEYTDNILDSGLPNPLKVLRATELLNDIYGEYFFQNIEFGHNYKWFCYPEILGENYVTYDVERDVSIVFADVIKVDIINDYGLPITYNCYRTEHEINSEITFKIKAG